MESKDADKILVDRIKNGEEQAFSELLKKYQQRAYYFCLHMVSDPQEAEDLAQEVFVRVFKNMKSFRGDASFQTWFYRILLNLCRSHLRHRYLVNRFTFRFPQADEGEEESQLSIETSIPDPSKDGDPALALDNRELQVALKQALDCLSAQQRQIFSLKHFEGLKISEIREITGQAEGTIKTHLFRAVQILQNKLKDFK